MLSNFGLFKGYNSVVECYLDVIEVISSNLIIPNVSMYKNGNPSKILLLYITILLKQSIKSKFEHIFSKRKSKYFCLSLSKD